jgi:membrane-associated HD superfamily phosphohydrolase
MERINQMKKMRTRGSSLLTGLFILIMSILLFLILISFFTVSFD